MAAATPAVLVIEDLDWLLEHTNVSTFLNLIDGVESDGGRAAGGLLLIATTNHPDKLDPAVNNRPGRFDVVVEIPPPDEVAGGPSSSARTGRVRAAARREARLGDGRAFVLRTCRRCCG